MLICSIILGVLQIIAEIWMFSTPLTTFTSYGYLIIVLFFVTGIFGVVNAIQEKKYGNNFFFSILSLILGFLGMVIPGVAVMTQTSHTQKRHEAPKIRQKRNKKIA